MPWTWALVLTTWVITPDGVPDGVTVDPVSFHQTYLECEAALKKYKPSPAYRNYNLKCLYNR